MKVIRLNLGRGITELSLLLKKEWANADADGCSGLHELIIFILFVNYR